MSDPILNISGVVQSLTWTPVAGPPATWQTVSDDGYSYTIEQVEPNVFRVDQLGTTYPSVEMAQEAAQNEYDSQRRLQAWHDFFASHEPPS